MRIATKNRITIKELIRNCLIFTTIEFVRSDFNMIIHKILIKFRKK